MTYTTTDTPPMDDVSEETVPILLKEIQAGLDDKSINDGDCISLTKPHIGPSLDGYGGRTRKGESFRLKWYERAKQLVVYSPSHTAGPVN